MCFHNIALKWLLIVILDGFIKAKNPWMLVPCSSLIMFLSISVERLIKTADLLSETLIKSLLYIYLSV